MNPPITVTLDPFDNEGYLINFKHWTPKLAESMAEKAGVVLTEKHWEILYLARKFYSEYSTAPSIGMLVKFAGKIYGPIKGTSQYLYQLFPSGPAKQILQFAGLPKSIRCV